MTVIAAYSGKGFGFLFADTLITTDQAYYNERVTLPITGRTISRADALDEHNKTFLYSYFRKITIISDRFAVAYAGDVDIAREIIDKIRRELSTYNGIAQPALETFNLILDPYRPVLGETVGIVGIMISIEGKNWNVLTVGTGLDEHDVMLDIFPNPLFITGTGADVMRENILTRLEATIGTLDGSDVASAGPLPLFNSLMAIGLQHFRELTGDRGLDEAFGGPFELVNTVRRKDGTPCLGYLSEVSFSYWSIESDGVSGVNIGLIQPILYQKHIYGALICATEHVRLGAMDAATRISNVTRSDFSISPIIMAADNADLKAIDDFVQNPYFAPETHVLIFIDQTVAGKIHKMVLWDNDYYSVSRSTQGFKMMMKQELLQPFKEWYASQKSAL